MTPSRTNDALLLSGVFVAMTALLSWFLSSLANDDTGVHRLPDEVGSYAALLVDGGELTCDEVASRPESDWRRLDGKGFLPVGRGEAAWVRVTLQNPGRRPMHGVLADTLCYSDRVELFMREPGHSGPGEWVHLRSGEWVRAEERALWGRETAFPVEVPAQGKQTVFLRYQDYFAVWQQFDWWPDSRDFYASQIRFLLAEGLYFGGLFALLFYSVALWVRLRFSGIGFYLLYFGFLILYLFLARSNLPLLGWRLGSPWIETIPMVFLALSGVSLTEFVRLFLDLEGRVPKAARATRWMRSSLLVLAGGALTVSWLGYGGALSGILLACGLVHIGLLGVAAVGWRAGAPQARYFVAAFGLFFVGTLAWAAVVVDFVPLRNSAMVMMLSLALEMALLSLSTADRFAHLQKEKLAAQRALLEEGEQRRILQEAYADELEVEVRERTRELEAAIEDKDRIMLVLGHDLRSPLTGLTQAAEQLDSTNAPATFKRFAGDAARTGRELLLMIEDLVIWARLRAGRIETSVHSVSELVTPVSALNQAWAELSGVELLLDVPEPLRVETDLVLAQTLVRNLVANALKVARQRVVVSAIVEGEEVSVEVRDDGPGLPSEIEEWLAGEGPPSISKGGGLGLRLCNEIGRALGARLKARGAPGGGTEFVFTLPMAIERVEYELHRAN